MVVARGEAVRNFLYSDTLPALSEHARVTLLSVLDDEKFKRRFENQVERIVNLGAYREAYIVRVLRELITMAHYRWIWTVKVKNKWEILDHQANTFYRKLRNKIFKLLAFLFANRRGLDVLAWLENTLSLWLIPTRDFHRLFEELQPDLVFNCSHIHAPRGELPVRVAHQMGIRTATFVFSWDNLSSRGRILPPYDDFLVWHQGMRDELLALYKFVTPKQVHITGTPQFDYHFKRNFHLTREELCARIGIEPSRPYVLYTTGMESDFPQEVYHVRTVIDILSAVDGPNKPQLVVRTYVKGNSPEMEALARQKIPDVVFPPILWEPTWFVPQYEDLSIYTSLLEQALFGINPASTVSMELMMFEKPVINIGFDPPGSQLAEPFRWIRHIEYDHYKQVAESGGVRVAYSVEDMRHIIHDFLKADNSLQEKQQAFLKATFGHTLDGGSGKRAAQVLLNLAQEKN